MPCRHLPLLAQYEYKGQFILRPHIGDYGKFQINLILILPAKTTVRVNINAIVQYCTMPIQWHYYEYLAIHCKARERLCNAILCRLTLPLCRCESECDLTLILRLMTMEPGYYRNFYSSSFAQPLPEAQRQCWEST